MKNVVITGAANGLGLSAAEYFAQQNCRVFALDYDQKALDKISNQNIVPIRADITDASSIETAVMEVKKHTETLDGVINYAGILNMGSLIELDVEVLRRILDINLLGMYRINQAFFPLILEGKGRIINISSECGALSATLFNGFYGIAKHAVELYNDALRRELAFLGIKVIKIRPGAFKTKMQGNAGDMLETLIKNTTHYKKILEKTRSMSKGMTEKAKDAKILSKLVYKAFSAKKPKILYCANNNFSQKFLSALPESWQDKIFKKVLG